MRQIVKMSGLIFLTVNLPVKTESLSEIHLDHFLKALFILFEDRKEKKELNYVNAFRLR